MIATITQQSVTLRQLELSTARPARGSIIPSDNGRSVTLPLRPRAGAVTPAAAGIADDEVSGRAVEGDAGGKASPAKAKKVNAFALLRKGAKKALEPQPTAGDSDATPASAEETGPSVPVPEESSTPALDSTNTHTTTSGPKRKGALAMLLSCASKKDPSSSPEDEQATAVAAESTSSGSHPPKPRDAFALMRRSASKPGLTTTNPTTGTSSDSTPAEEGKGHIPSPSTGDDAETQAGQPQQPAAAPQPARTLFSYFSKKDKTQSKRSVPSNNSRSVADTKAVPAESGSVAHTDSDTTMCVDSPERARDPQASALAQDPSTQTSDSSMVDAEMEPSTTATTATTLAQAHEERAPAHRYNTRRRAAQGDEGESSVAAAPATAAAAASGEQPQPAQTAHAEVSPDEILSQRPARKTRRHVRKRNAPATAVKSLVCAPVKRPAEEPSKGISPPEKKFAIDGSSEGESSVSRPQSTASIAPVAAETVVPATAARLPEPSSAAHAPAAQLDAAGDSANVSGYECALA